MIHHTVHPYRIRLTLAVMAVCIFSGAGALIAAPGPDSEVPDWPQWRGPDRTGISLEADWLGEWPGDGPKVVWRASVGTGFSSMAVSGGLVYTMGNTATGNKDEVQKDMVFCFDAVTGDLKWKHEYDCPLSSRMFEGGPTATPTVADGAVYTFSQRGHAFCLDAKTGKVKWARNLEKEEGLKPPKWGFAGSVTILGDLAIFNAGDAGTALNKKTGKTVWKSSSDGAGYSTPLPFKRGAKEGIMLFAAKEMVAVNPRSGKRLWDIPWETSYDVNASEPILTGDVLFLSTGYKRGCALFKFKGNGFEEIYQHKQMSNQCNSSVLFKGHIYGFDGNVGGRGILKCLDIESGEETWSHKGLGTGSLMMADGKLIILGEKGTLAIAEASPDGYKVLQEAQILTGKCWTVPVLWNGKVYARNAPGELVCVDVKAAGG